MTVLEITFSVMKEESGKTDCHSPTTETVWMVLFEELLRLTINTEVYFHEVSEAKTSTSYEFINNSFD